jgi:hypothetical protein
LREPAGPHEIQNPPKDGPDALGVREQLARVLSSLVFRNSKRYPAMLRYVVEHALEGNGGDLKERTIGVEVFGRPPDYEPGTDPVVRISAAEIRKRLAQYYQEPAHGAEIRIALPVGAYVPKFEPPAVGLHPAVNESLLVPQPRRSPAWVLVMSAAAVLITLGVAWIQLRPQRSELERFWAPVMAQGGKVLVCVASGAPASLTNSATPGGAGAFRVGWADTLTLARLAGFLQMRGLAVQFCREDQATFNDFQLMPSVLIGGLNDEWALKLMENLRFQFRREGSMFWVFDRNHPESRDWSVEAESVAYQRDYAVISRVHNSRTGKITVTVAGLRGPGTLAAGKFVSDPDYFREAAKKLPTDWRNRNMQLVLSAEVIGGNPGPPQMLSSIVW